MAGALQHDAVPILSLVGVVLDALGGLYLAYDLLGDRRGPLRTFTKSVSYGVMFGTLYALPLASDVANVNTESAVMVSVSPPLFWS